MASIDEATTSPRITTVESLHHYLYAAMQLEHATLPPYLMALYSIHPGTNSDAFHIIRVVAIEEMLHLSLVANVLNAVGGTPDLTKAGFVPLYPAYLPDGEDDFQVDLQPFSAGALETMLKIERPRRAAGESSRLVARNRPTGTVLAAAPDEPGMAFYSIGEFYAEIERGLRHLHRQYTEEGKELFCGDPGRQITPEYYFSGGGAITVVHDVGTACAALRLIAEQGEGLGGGIYDREAELAHYYRFQQLQLGHYYQQGDEPDHPSGPPLTVDWDAAYPAKVNARLDDYPSGSELLVAARQFNEGYAEYLAFLTRAFNGERELLVEAVWRMFRLRDGIGRLIHNPIPGIDGTNAAPTFEVTAAEGGTAS